ncbi:MAG: acyltransferase [Brevinema sp.]
MKTKVIIEDQNITWTKAIACLLVVIVHAAEQWHYTYSANTRVFLMTSFIIAVGRVAVPLFFMISGHLLFSKNVEPTSKIVWMRFQSIFRPLVFFFIVYYLYQVVSGHGWNPVGSDFLAKNIAHLWYLGFMLPVYTFSPFIRPPRLLNRKQGLFLFGMIFFIFIVTESLMAKPFPFMASYYFNQPLLYMMIGYVLKYAALRNRSLSLTIWIFFGFILLTMINYILIIAASNELVFKVPGWGISLHILEYMFGNQGEILESFKTLGVLIQSALLFYFLQSMHPQNIKNSFLKIQVAFLSYISRHSLTIYGWHMMYIHIIHNIALAMQMRYALPVIFMGSIPCALASGYAWQYIKEGFLYCWRKNRGLK